MRLSAHIVLVHIYTQWLHIIINYCNIELTAIWARKHALWWIYAFAGPGAFRVSITGVRVITVLIVTQSYWVYSWKNNVLFWDTLECDSRIENLTSWKSRTIFCVSHFVLIELKILILVKSHPNIVHWIKDSTIEKTKATCETGSLFVSNTVKQSLKTNNDEFPNNLTQYSYWWYKKFGARRRTSLAGYNNIPKWIPQSRLFSPGIALFVKIQNSKHFHEHFFFTLWFTAVLLPELIRTVCGKCSPRQKDMVRQVLKHVYYTRNADFNRIMAIYDTEGKRDQIIAFMNQKK